MLLILQPPSVVTVQVAVQGETNLPAMLGFLRRSVSFFRICRSRPSCVLYIHGSRRFQMGGERAARILAPDRGAPDLRTRARVVEFG